MTKRPFERQYGLSLVGMTREQVRRQESYERMVSRAAKDVAEQVGEFVYREATSIAISFPDAHKQQVMEDIVVLAMGMIE